LPPEYIGWTNDAPVVEGTVPSESNARVFRSFVEFTMKLSIRQPPLAESPAHASGTVLPTG
jgi:hypothetical protein